MAGNCGPCRSVGVCWWAGSVCPGWTGAAGCFRAAWPPGKPAWPPAEPRTTAARSERQVGREKTERQTRVESGAGLRGE